MKLYKVLQRNMVSPSKYFQFELGKKYVCGNFDHDITKDCSYGFYATGIDGLIYTNLSNNKKVFEVGFLFQKKSVRIL